MPSSPPAAPVPVVVYGGGGHGKQVIDLLRRHGGWAPDAVVDDRLSPGTSIAGVEVVGGRDALAGILERGTRHAINAVGGIDDIDARAQVFELLDELAFEMPTIVDPTAVVEATAVLADACQVFAHAYVGSDAHLERGVLVNTAAVVSHDCVLGAVTNLSPGALLAGEVTTGPLVRVGMGATVNVGVHLGERSRVGNGATVKADVAASGRVRAGHLWPPD